MRTIVSIVVFVTSLSALAQEQPAAVPRLLSAQDLSVNVEPETLQRQFNALQSMRLDAVEYSFLGSVTRIVGDTGIELPFRATTLKEGDHAEDIIQLFGDLLLAKGSEKLIVTRHDDVGFNPNPSIRSLRLTQKIRGIPVVNSFLGLNYDDRTRQVSKFVAHFIPDRGLDPYPKVPPEQAERLVPEAIASTEKTSTKQVEILAGTHLGYYHVPEDPTPPRLVWVIQVQADGMQWEYYVNSITGNLIDRRPLTSTLGRQVYDANGAEWTIPDQLPATSMTISQINASAHGAKAAYDHVLVADTKLRQRFTLPGVLFPSSTRQIIRYFFLSPNAWHHRIGAYDYIAYSGLTPTTNSSTGPRDITSHEYAHGVGKRTFSAGTDLFDFQGLALHEGFADIGAATVHVAENGSPSTASWRIGEGWFFVAPSAVVRSMANPADVHSSQAVGQDWFPVRGMFDVHIHQNSTILSHAYYLSIYGGLNAGWLKAHIPEIIVPPLSPLPLTAEAQARAIFISAFADVDVSLQPKFLTVKNEVMNTANILFGSAARTSVKTAFEAVGVGYQCTAPPSSVPNFSLFDLQCAGRFSVNWPDIPGANRYIAQVAPQLYGWSFAQIAVDGDLNNCMPQVSTPSMIRMRACNNCGCGAWSATQNMPYFPGPCP